MLRSPPQPMWYLTNSAESEAFKFSSASNFVSYILHMKLHIFLCKIHMHILMLSMIQGCGVTHVQKNSLDQS